MPYMKNGGSQAITSTGPKGFLTWFKREQPAIYAQIAPALQQKYPQAFSGYMSGGWRFHSLADDSPTVDTSDAANTGAVATDIANGISQVIGTASAAYLNYEQQQQQNAIVNAQLENAVLGRPPLNVSLTGNGVPQVSFAATTAGQFSLGTALLWGVGLYAGAKLLKVI
jgi:hypothetical protein